MTDGLKLSEEPEATAFLTKSRVMINKVVNQGRSMAEVRAPSSIVPDFSPYEIDFSRYHNLCQQVNNFLF